MTEHFFMRNNNHPQKKKHLDRSAVLTVHEQLFLDKGKRVCVPMGLNLGIYNKV